MAENELPDPRRPGGPGPWHGPAPSLPQYGPQPGPPQYGERPPPPLRGQQPPPPPPPPLPNRRPPTPQGPPRQSPQPPPEPPTRTPRLVGALAMAVAAVVATVFTVTWIWNKAEALSPVDLPSANGTPLEKIDPSVKPTATPPPQGKYVDGNLVAWNNDRMPGMPVPTWEDLPDVGRTGLSGGISMWMVVHDNYDGAKDWGNLVAFGGLGKGIPYNSTPAGMKLAAQHVGARLVSRLYDEKTVPIKGSVKHRTLTVDGHRAHELIARVPVKEPKLKQETNSVISIVVIDRGDGTAMASIGDFAGTTTGWFLYWRNQVQKIQINR